MEFISTKLAMDVQSPTITFITIWLHQPVQIKQLFTLGRGITTTYTITALEDLQHMLVDIPGRITGLLHLKEYT